MRVHPALPLLLALIATVLPGPAHAFRFIPFTAEFRPSGPEANQTFRIENNSDSPIAVEITIHRRAMKADGSDVLTPGEDDFVIFPAQVVLPPAESQIVRVQWAGEPTLEQERAYRIIAEQLPIDLDEEQGTGGSVKILVRYVGSIYVAPAGASPDVVLESVEPARSAEGEPRLAVLLRNRGTAHTILKGVNLRVGGESAREGERVLLADAQLTGLSGENILGQTQRRFLVPWPERVPYGSVSAALEIIPPEP